MRQRIERLVKETGGKGRERHPAGDTPANSPAEERKIRIVLEGLRGEESIAELCCREGIVRRILYYRWSKDFLECREG